MEADARSRLFELVAGFMVTQALGVVVRLGVPDLVSERPRSVGELAAAADADADALRRLLRTLRGRGVFTEQGGVVRHTELSELLRSDVPASMAAQCMLLSGLQYTTWRDALETFRTGEPAFVRVHGRPMFDWFSDHGDEATLFNAAMAAGATVRRERLRARDWSKVSTVVDVGGGTGSTLFPLLGDHPHLSGVVVDLPHVREEAVQAIEAAGLAGRCSFTTGSFFESVPAGADVYILSVILHDWDDERAAAILTTVHAAMAPASKLVLVESVVGSGTEPDNATLMDLHMLVALGGRERSEEEWRDLLSSTGFAVTLVEPGLIEADPV